LPVSSTGHLLLAERIMSIGENTKLSAAEQEDEKTAADAYAICIQAGALLSKTGQDYKLKAHFPGIRCSRNHFFRTRFPSCDLYLAAGCPRPGNIS